MQDRELEQILAGIGEALPILEETEALLESDVHFQATPAGQDWAKSTKNAAKVSRSAVDENIDVYSSGSICSTNTPASISLQFCHL